MKDIVKLQISIKFSDYIGLLTWADGEISEFKSSQIEDLLAKMADEIVTKAEENDKVEGSKDMKEGIQ
jgi:hypothetical protein